MAPYWNVLWGNPSNTSNRSGVFASAAVEVSREKIASQTAFIGMYCHCNFGKNEY